MRVVAALLELAPLVRDGADRVAFGHCVSGDCVGAVQGEEDDEGGADPARRRGLYPHLAVYQRDYEADHPEHAAGEEGSSSGVREGFAWRAEGVPVLVD